MPACLPAAHIYPPTALLQRRTASPGTSLTARPSCRMRTSSTCKRRRRSCAPSEMDRAACCSVTCRPRGELRGSLWQVHAAVLLLHSLLPLPLLRCLLLLLLSLLACRSAIPGRGRQCSCCKPALLQCHVQLLLAHPFPHCRRNVEAYALFDNSTFELPMEIWEKPSGWVQPLFKWSCRVAACHTQHPIRRRCTAAVEWRCCCCALPRARPPHARPPHAGPLASPPRNVHMCSAHCMLSPLTSAAAAWACARCISSSSSAPTSTPG